MDLYRVPSVLSMNSIWCHSVQGDGGQHSNDDIGSEAAFDLPERVRSAIEDLHVDLPVPLHFSASFSPQIKDAKQRWTVLGILRSRHAQRSHC